ncbi:unnamed protein product [Blepharisma stoltei]|uniref:Uncharacterized protein n=1 Tax=Blepharisma stoltei TaxID=1481888 RepID=A0AAU9JFC5_9CILI|nr:unnamed protein product [Blepharisma stoltei]
MDHNSICLDADIKKYQGRVRFEGIIFLIIYIIPAVIIFCTLGMEGLEGFTGLFFIYPLLGCLALEALQNNDLKKLERYKKILYFASYAEGIIGFVSFLIAAYFLMNVINFECTEEMYDTCGTNIGLQSFMLFVFGVIMAVSIITLGLTYISYRHSLALLELLSQLHPNNFGSLNYQFASSPQYIPMQSIP